MAPPLGPHKGRFGVAIKMKEGAEAASLHTGTGTATGSELTACVCHAPRTSRLSTYRKSGQSRGAGRT